MMFDDPAMKHEGDVFCDIGGEVGDAFKVFRDPQDIDAVAYNGRMPVMYIMGSRKI